MKNSFVLFLLILFSSCDQDIEIDRSIEGSVVSYSESEDGIIRSRNDVLANGTPVENARLDFYEIQYDHGGTCCGFGKRVGRELYCFTDSHIDGSYECEYSEFQMNDEQELSHKDFNQWKKLSSTDDELNFVMYNTVPVVITGIDVAPFVEQGDVFSYHLEGINLHLPRSTRHLVYPDYVEIGNVRYYTDTLQLMENVNIKINYKPEEEVEWLDEIFYSGNSNSLREITFEF